VVNVAIPEPYPPGPWIEAEFDDDDRLVDIRCICGAHPGTYRRFNSGVTFGEAADALRTANQLAEVAESQGTLEFKPHLTGGDWHDEAPGGFRSRRAVLWMMRVIKLQAFYDAHRICGDDLDWEEFCENFPGHENCEAFEEWLQRGGPGPVGTLDYLGDDYDDDEGGEGGADGEDDWIPF
jgi:hypothetical protein